MPSKILIINSSNKKNCLLIEALKELAQKNFSFSLWSSSDSLVASFRQKAWPVKKINLGPALNNSVKILFFLIVLPLSQFKFFLLFLKCRLGRQIDAITCLNLNEKIIVTIPARLAGIKKIIWLEDPGTDYNKINKILFALYKINSRLAELIIFNGYAKSWLTNAGFKDAKLSFISPGIKPSSYQENIFNKLAANGQAKFHKKYFTIGTVAELGQKQKIETIFQAVKTCLPVIPNIQLIIIGEGGERKNLLWLAKKMGIENLVWLVGEQEQLKKWLESFDIFLAVNENPGLDDYGNILEAMASSLPILAPRNIGLEEIIIENKTGSLIEMQNNEMLSRQIIKLHQDKKLRLQLGKNGSERAGQIFSLEKMAGEMEKILI